MAGRKGKSRRTDNVKISSGVCDGEIETEGKAEIILKAEMKQERQEGVCANNGNRASDSVTQGETFV